MSQRLKCWYRLWAPHNHTIHVHISLVAVLQHERHLVFSPQLPSGVRCRFLPIKHRLPRFIHAVRQPNDLLAVTVPRPAPSRGVLPFATWWMVTVATRVKS
ncbi:exo-alpha-sialidase [Trypanosoma cruzi]|nr:exo-alpha-sialidase [Trypanosoma cruzi]